MEEKNVVKHICDKGETIDDILLRVRQLEVTQHGMDILIQQFTETSSTLTTTMLDVQRTMQSMQYSLEQNGKDISAIRESVDKTNKKVDKEAEKSKIDIRDIFKTLATKGLLVLFGGFGIYKIILELVEKHG